MQDFMHLFLPFVGGVPMVALPVAFSAAKWWGGIGYRGRLSQASLLLTSSLHACVTSLQVLKPPPSSGS